MKNKTSYFWTDATQASERLRNSTILYDGLPYFVLDIENNDDGIPRAILSMGGKSVRKKLNSPKFKKFRELPPIGWFNSSRRGVAQLIERRVISTRTHGLSTNNTVLYEMSCKTAEMMVSERDNYQSICQDKGYIDAVKKTFPALPDILSQIRKQEAIAYNSMFCVVRDADGIRWLFRNQEKIGLFTGVGSLMLINSKNFYREEIQDDPSFTLNTIQEF